LLLLVIVFGSGDSTSSSSTANFVNTTAGKWQVSSVLNSIGSITKIVVIYDKSEPQLLFHYFYFQISAFLSMAACGKANKYLGNRLENENAFSERKRAVISILLQHSFIATES
jgi:hypothetical protein